MRIRTYEYKNSAGEVITSGTQGWWQNTIVMSDLSPHPVKGIAGMVAARGGWCDIGNWQKPEDPHTLQCDAYRWAELLAQQIDISPYTGSARVIDSIAKVLELLEDERLNPPPTPGPDPVPDPVPDEPVV